MRIVTRTLIASALFACCIAAPIRPLHKFDRGPEWVTYGGTVRKTIIARSDTTNSHNSLTLTDTNTLSTLARQATKSSTFVFQTGFIPEGIEITEALAAAKDIMESSWVSSQEVLVNVTFARIGGKDVLASGSGTRFVTPKGRSETLTIGAAEAILGKGFNPPGTPEIEITMNSGALWHTSTGTSVPPTQYDFITVLLHEIYHHLMFTGRLVVRVDEDKENPKEIKQTLTLPTGVTPTRFDNFLANKEGCQVLGYQDATALSTKLGRSTNELVADALTNNNLFFQASNVASSQFKMHAPRVWVPKSSAYHFDPTVVGADKLMAPEIDPGNAIREISLRILNMQTSYLNSGITGSKVCDPANLTDPTPLLAVPSDGRIPGSLAHGSGVAGGATDAPASADNRGAPAAPIPAVTTERRIAGMRTWVFALVMVFSILAGILLIGLCIFLVLTFLKARKKTVTEEYESEMPSYDDDEDGTANGYENGDEIPGSQDQPGGFAADSGTHGDGSHDGLGEGSAPGGLGQEGTGEGKGLDDATGTTAVAAAGKGKKNGVDDGEDFSGDGSGDHAGREGAYGRSECPESSKKSRRRHGPSVAPETFDPSSVPSPYSSRKRSGSKHAKGCKDYYTESSSSEYSDPTRSKSKSSKRKSRSHKKPGSICPPSTAPPVCHDGKNGVDGGPFDCDSPTTDLFDCDTTIFDCNTMSKSATAFGISEKPIPKLYNPSSSSHSQYLYMDSQTTDSSHLRPYERGVSHKNSVSKGKHSPRLMATSNPPKKSSRKPMPMSLAPSTEDCHSEVVKPPSTKVPASNAITRSSSKRSDKHSSKHSSKHAPQSDYYTSNYSGSDDYGKKSCDYDSTISDSQCRARACKPMSVAPTTSIAPSDTDAFDCDYVPSKKCKSSKSSHSENSSCKKSSSYKDDGKENQCSNGKKSSSKHSTKKSSSCKRSKSSESIKSGGCKSMVPSTKPPSCTADESSMPPSSDYDSSKHPSSCPPSEPEKSAPKSCCPSSEKKQATRYESSSRRRREKTETDFTSDWSDSEETKSRRYKDPVKTKVTTRTMKAKYEDGRLVDKKSRTKETTKKYHGATTTDPTSMYFDYTSTNSPTDSTSIYTSSYFMSEDDKTAVIKPTAFREDDEKSSRPHRHEDERERRHRARSRSQTELTRSRSGKDSHHQRESRHRSRSRSRHDDDELRRSRSEKDMTYEKSTKYTETKELKRAKSNKDGIKKSKSHHAISTKYLTPVALEPTQVTRRTDIHTVALDPEVQREYEKEKSSRREKSRERERRHRERDEDDEERKSRSRSRSKSRSRRERSPNREGRREHEREHGHERSRSRSRSRHDRKRSPSRRERSPSRERRRERSPSRERRRERSGDDDRTTVVKKKKVTTTRVRVTNGDEGNGMTTTDWTESSKPWSSETGTTSEYYAREKRSGRSRSKSRTRIMATSMDGKTTPLPSSCPPTSSSKSKSSESYVTASDNTPELNGEDDEPVIDIKYNGRKVKPSCKTNEDGLKISVNVKSCR